MERATEIKLAKELIDLHGRQSAFLDDAVATRPVDHYLDAERFANERGRIFRALPQPAVHSSELPAPGSFLTRGIAGLPVLVTRDADGIAHAFVNVCRHRGTRLVDDERGCKQRFSCPYHAWTFSNRGELVSVPHEALGFPGLDRADMGLARLGCAERHGWVWVCASSDEAPDVDDALAGLARDFDWFGGTDLTVLHTDEQLRAVNWKLVVEGGIEAYHFRVAHRDTIGPYYADNLSSYQRFGPHLRTVIARRSLSELAGLPTEDWRLRDYAQLLYTLLPGSSLLVQADHVAWIQIEPLSAASTRIRINTVVPTDRVEAEADLAHWAKNHAITLATLNEDFDIAESIQAGLDSGANEYLTFGRFEGALAVFNDTVDSRL